MVANALHHVSLNVDDVPAAVAFYTALGFRQVERPDFEFDGAWMRLGEAVSSISSDSHRRPTSVSTSPCMSMISTMRLQRSKLEHHCAAHGRDRRYCRQAFLSDPSGNLVELNQPRSAGNRQADGKPEARDQLTDAVSRAP